MRRWWYIREEDGEEDLAAVIITISSVPIYTSFAPHYMACTTIPTTQTHTYPIILLYYITLLLLLLRCYRADNLHFFPLYTHTHTHVICPGTTRAFHRVFTFFLSLRPPTPSRQTLTIYACTHTKPRHTKSLRRRIHAHFIQTGPAMTTHYYKCPFTKKENIGTSTTSAGPPPRGLQIVFESERATENTACTYTCIYIFIVSTVLHSDLYILNAFSYYITII